MKNRFRLHDKKKIVSKILVGFAAATLLASTVFTPATMNAQAGGTLSGSQFNPGRIIDDVVFYNHNTMTPSQIQAFLNAKVPHCDTNGDKHYGGTTRRAYSAARGISTPFICLKDYKQSVPAVVNGGSDLCKNSISAGTKTAAQIIYDVAKACGINPQVLIVLLQKEQSLVTDDWPWPIQYRSATGYGCPDTAPCDSEYYGFFNQVYQAAKAFRRYEANPTWYNYRHGRNNTILWHPNTACGSSTVYIENQATASLYIYTPYRPNQAALNNLYGTGDGCSSYGNRNFWRMFNDWFGPPLQGGPGAVYRLYNQNTNNHLYTTSISERNKAIQQASFTYEGLAFTACLSGGKDVYRLYNPRNGRHLFTASAAERDKADQKTSFNKEGTAFRACGDKNVYRLYSAREQKHFYTTSASERDNLVKNTSFVYEGIAFKVK